LKLTVSGTLEFNIEEEKPRIIFTIKYNGIQLKDPDMLVLANDHKVTASIQPVDAKGNPATIDGLAAWSSSSTDIVNVTNVSADSLSADVIPGTAMGTAQINVTADADLGSGVTTINGVLDVQVVAGQAVGFTISTSPPVPV
jgi:hypothetical protein